MKIFKIFFICIFSLFVGLDCADLGGGDHGGDLLSVSLGSSPKGFVVSQRPQEQYLLDGQSSFFTRMPDEALDIFDPATGECVGRRSPSIAANIFNYVLQHYGLNIGKDVYDVLPHHLQQFYAPDRYDSGSKVPQTYALLFGPLCVIVHTSTGKQELASVENFSLFQETYGARIPQQTYQELSPNVQHYYAYDPDKKDYFLAIGGCYGGKAYSHQAMQDIAALRHRKHSVYRFGRQVPFKDVPFPWSFKGPNASQLLAQFYPTTALADGDDCAAPDTTLSSGKDVSTSSAIILTRVLDDVLSIVDPDTDDEVAMRDPGLATKTMKDLVVTYGSTISYEAYRKLKPNEQRFYSPSRYDKVTGDPQEYIILAGPMRAVVSTPAGRANFADVNDFVLLAEVYGPRISEAVYNALSKARQKYYAYDSEECEYYLAMGGHDGNKVHNPAVIAAAILSAGKDKVVRYDPPVPFEYSPPPWVSRPSTPAHVLQPAAVSNSHSCDGHTVVEVDGTLVRVDADPNRGKPPRDKLQVTVPGPDGLLERQVSIDDEHLGDTSHLDGCILGGVCGSQVLSWQDALCEEARRHQARLMRSTPPVGFPLLVLRQPITIKASA